MARFFNRIRKQLAKDNKFFQYSRYAIGEILLVVIGILIALQVNNWNERRQDRISEAVFLSRIHEDLIVDNAYFKRRIDDSEQFIDASSEFFTTLSANQRSFEDVMQLAEAFTKFYNSEMLTTQNSTFSEILYGGKLELITDAALKSQLLDYYRRNEEVGKHIAEFNAFSVDALNMMVDKATNFFSPGIYPKRFSFEEEYGYQNDPTSDKVQIIDYTAGVYAHKHNLFLGYFRELEGLSADLINRLEGVE